MFIADDPLLALIVRFVINDDEPDISNEEILRRQLRTLKEYVARFPPEQQGARAMKWIERHAETYRRTWQQRTVSRRTFALRCADCPLRRLDATEHCEIHEQWLYLLRQYTAGEIQSKAYVKDTLRLLKSHKKQLKKRASGKFGKRRGTPRTALPEI